MEKDKKFSNLFVAQTFSDEDGKKIITSYLRTILLVTIFILPVYLILKLVQAKEIFAADIIIIGLELFFLFLLILLKKGQLILTSILFLASAWTALTLMACYADGIKDVAVVGYIIIMFINRKLHHQ
ncbi:MAG: hypothetical protein ABSA76_04470 [Bacteroidales bacterium]